MIEEKDIFLLNHFEYGDPFNGCHEGMHYRIARLPLKNVHYQKEKGDAQLEVTIWKGPYTYLKTTEEKITQLFPYSEEGRKSAIDWLNIQYNAQPAMWAEGRKLL